jgi:hypothetical protein
MLNRLNIKPGMIPGKQVNYPEKVLRNGECCMDPAQRAGLGAAERLPPPLPHHSAVRVPDPKKKPLSEIPLTTVPTMRRVDIVHASWYLCLTLSELEEIIADTE